jgi:hypothetical protein
MSALVWSVESVVLGLWALVFSLYSNPFHSFVAYSHVLISGFTLIAHLFAAARDLPIRHAISDAFVCAVCSLFVVYLMAIFDVSNPLLFSMSVLGDFLPLDACIGLAWFSAALVSALGMALSERGRRCTLMFHHFGYHMLIVPPSFLVFWLYNYDGAAAEPVSGAIAYLYRGIRITHFLYTMVLVGIWGAFVVLQATGECLRFEAEWPDFERMSANGGLRYALSVLLKLAGRAACVLIPISAAFTAKTSQQVILAWVLTGIGAVNALDWLKPLDYLLLGRRNTPAPLEDSESRSLGVRFRAPSNLDPAAVALSRDKNV